MRTWDVLLCIQQPRSLCWCYWFFLVIPCLFFLTLHSNWIAPLSLTLKSCLTILPTSNRQGFLIALKISAGSTTSFVFFMDKGGRRYKGEMLQAPLKTKEVDQEEDASTAAVNQGMCWKVQQTSQKALKTSILLQWRCLHVSITWVRSTGMSWCSYDLLWMWQCLIRNMSRLKLEYRCACKRAQCFTLLTNGFAGCPLHQSEAWRCRYPPKLAVTKPIGPLQCDREENGPVTLQRFSVGSFPDGYVTWIPRISETFHRVCLVNLLWMPCSDSLLHPFMSRLYTSSRRSSSRITCCATRSKSF